MLSRKRLKTRGGRILLMVILVSIAFVIARSNSLSTTLLGERSYVTASKHELQRDVYSEHHDVLDSSSKDTVGWIDRKGGAPSAVTVTIDSPTFPNETLTETKCIGAVKRQAEDLFCLERPKTLKHYKNQCWKDGKGAIKCLPYFHLATSKCGSTDLFLRIKQHPDVLGCTECFRGGKETWYWAWDRYGFAGKSKYRPIRTFSKYTEMFDNAAKRIKEEITNGIHNIIIGDGSPMDFWDFRGWTKIPQNKGLSEPRVLTPHLMRHMYRDFRMILILRNPVDRLYSDYYFSHQGNKPESFHRDAVRSIDMMKECLRNNSLTACFYSHSMYYRLPTRIHVGCYVVFLKEWLSVFPRENFLILRTEDYKVDPTKTLLDVFDFLKLRVLDFASFEAILKREQKNVTATKKKAPPMFNSTRVLLTDFYAQYNTELYRIMKDERFLWGIL